MKIKLNLFIVILVGLLSCKHEPINPNTNTLPTNKAKVSINCSTDSVYFENDILPIIISNCAMAGCHDANSSKDGVILDNYLNIIATGEIIAGNASKSELFEVITEKKSDKIMPPPPNQPLTAEQINKIEQWINQGALNNKCQPDSSNCDTANVSFANSIMPLIDTYCKGCHSGSAPSAGILLTNYPEIKAQADNGYLLGVIDHRNGFKPMPQGGNKIAQCDIDKISAWINQGTLNN